RAAQLRKLRAFHATSEQLPYLEDVFDAALAIINSPAPPGVRAAAFRMLAAQPGIRGLGVAHDALGRPGVALAVRTRELTPARRTQEVEEHLIVDQSSARVLAREYYAVGADGTVEAQPDQTTLIIGSGWTDRIGLPVYG